MTSFMSLTVFGYHLLVGLLRGRQIDHFSGKKLVFELIVENRIEFF